MGIRIQPREIEIPDHDPFEHDLLERKQQVEVLTRLVSNVDGPCAMAVDAAWGSGKTTFLRMWARHLRNQNFPVVEFNAWETDFTGDPFIALSSEITEGLGEWTEVTVGQKIKETKRVAKKVLRQLAPGAIRLASGIIPVIGTEIGHAASSYAEELLTDYPEAQRSLKEFKTELASLAEALWEYSEHKPLVVFIDELDRCRPSYAIELLETGKHIFGVDHVLFVLAVNRTELAHSVKSLYGSGFDADGYLRRFFDIDLRLPEPNRDQFIKGLLDSIGIVDYLNRTKDRHTQMAGRGSVDAIRTFFSQPDLSLRTVGQSIHRFGLVLSSLGDEEWGFVRTLSALTILSTVDPSLYRRFVGGESTDEEIVADLFGNPAYAALRSTSAGTMVEAVVVAAGVGARDFHRPTADLKTKAPLFCRYMELAITNPPTDPNQRQEWEHAHDVYQMATDFHGASGVAAEPLGFPETIQRLELISPDLMGIAENP